VVDLNGIASTYSGPDFDTIATLSLPLVEQENVIGMFIHPTGRNFFLASNRGHIFMLTLAVDGSTLNISTHIVDDTLNNTEVQYSCIRLHPDGLLLAAGRSDGKICMWDLQASKPASTFTVRATLKWCLIVIICIDMTLTSLPNV
jgi:WD40 repeat protein